MAAEFARARRAMNDRPFRLAAGECETWQPLFGIAVRCAGRPGCNRVRGSAVCPYGLGGVEIILGGYKGGEKGEPRQRVVTSRRTLL